MSSFARCLVPAAAGLLCISLLSACGESEPTTCADDECEETRQGSSRKDGGVKDPDSKGADAGKDAGKATDAGKSGRTDAGQKPGDTAGGGKGKGGLPCDVAAILASRCGTCHGEEPAFGAPAALASAADFEAASVQALVKQRITATDPRKAMPPASSPALTPAELETLTAWLDDGAPESSEACGDAPDTEGDEGKPGPIDTSDLECFKMVAHAGDGKTPYKVGVAKDAYFNFTFKAPWQGMAYGIVIRPVIDNEKAIHHWLLFQDDLPGTPGGAVPSIGAHPGGQLLNGWAPGGEATDFRATGADVGLELPGDTTYTVEFHYNSSDAQATDASGVELCVQRKKPANIAGLSWLGIDQLLLPSAKWTGTCRPQSKEPIHILSVTPHMHKAGIHMKGTINRANGTKEVLHDKPFDFNYQIGFNKNVTLMPGDTITTECTFSKPMAFGESTEAEMCYLFTMAYPKGALADSGLWGRIAHGGSACLGQ